MFSKLHSFVTVLMLAVSAAPAAFADQSGQPPRKFEFVYRCDASACERVTAKDVTERFSNTRNCVKTGGGCFSDPFQKNRLLGCNVVWLCEVGGGPRQVETRPF